MRNAVLRLHNYSDCTEHIPYGEKFSQDKIFAVFADLSQTAKIFNSENFTHNANHTFFL